MVATTQQLSEEYAKIYYRNDPVKYDLAVDGFLNDPRVSKWSMMKDPSAIFTIISVYLYMVYIYLPKYMQNRKPYDIKYIIQIYNVIQIAACTYLVYGMCKEGWLNQYTLGCQLVDYSNDKSAKAMLGYVYWTFILKLVELLETMFFLLRHKTNQVSRLHVYHHCSTLMLAWVTCKYMGGGMASFAMVLNSFIHILMYSYYFLSALGPEIQNKLAPVKSKLTMMQMGQFWILLLHAAQTFHPDCSMPNLAAYIFLPNMVVLFSFFFNFYIQTYKNKKLKVI